jgi:hypothetical protein
MLDVELKKASFYMQKDYPKLNKVSCNLNGVYDFYFKFMWVSKLELVSYNNHYAVLNAKV